MKSLLMHADRDFDLERELPANHEALVQDLELTTVFEAMAGGDDFLFDVARRAILLGLADPEAILYRQAVLGDCLELRGIVRELYELAVDAIASERQVYLSLFRDSPDAVLSRSVRVLELFLGSLERLRRVTDEHGGRFRSEGFARFFATVERELDDDYLARVEGHLTALAFRRGLVAGAELGRGNRGTRYVLRRPRRRGWLPSLPGRSGYGFQVPEQDESGLRALADLRARGINDVANALAQSVDHIRDFFRTISAELAFYLGCVNLHERLAERGVPTCFPQPLGAGSATLSATGLHDVSLSLVLDGSVVGSDLGADGRRLVLVTGANQGGKSTFLRSVGLAQLLMQCGMFAPAESFRASVAEGVFTHYAREEDETMQSGKLDEELGRMSAIVDALRPGSLLLCNESFASTNEREGSELARQVVGALVDSGVRVVFVTHLFEFADGLRGAGRDDVLFLRAEREPDGRRTFRVVEGEPLPTSYGADLFRQIFGRDPGAARAPARVAPQLLPRRPAPSRRRASR